MPDKSLQKERQEKIALGILMLSVLFMGNKYFYKPLGTKLKKAEVELAKNYEVYQKMKQKTLSLKMMKKDIKAIQEVVNKTEKNLPKEKNVPSLLNIITYRMNANGIKMVSFYPLQKIEKEYSIEFPFKVEVSGRYHNLARFFISLGQAKRIIHIKDLELEALNNGKKSKDSLTARFTLITFTYKGKNK